MKKIVYSLLFLALMASCGQSKKASTSNDTTATDTTAATADTAGVDTTQIDGTTSATAKANEVLFNGTITLSPQRHATVSPSMGGVVRSTTLLPGRFVSRGAVVATIQNSDFITLQQTYLESHAQIEYLRAEYERQKTLSSQQAASQKKLQQAKAEYMAMQSKLQASASQLQLLGVAPSSIINHGIIPLIRVKAPISGYVSNVTVNIGKYLQEGEALCDIIDKSGLMICLSTYEKDIAKLRAGSTVEFHVAGLGDHNFHAKVISIGQKVDQVNRSLEVYATITDATPQLRPGMYVTARLAY